MSNLELFIRTLAYIGGAAIVLVFLGCGIAGLMGWLDERNMK